MLRAFLACGVVGAGLSVLPAPAQAAGQTLQVGLTQVTGTGPFDADDLPGRDSSATNDVVRTNDTVTYSVGVRYEDPVAPAEGQTNPTIRIVLPRGEELVSLPAFCLQPGSSVTPATVGAPVLPTTATSYLSLAQQTVVCRVANQGPSTSLDYEIKAKVRPEVPDGIVLGPVTASVTSTEVTTPVVSPPVQHEVSARANFDLSKRTTSAAETSGPVLGYDVTCTFDATRGCRRVEFPLTVTVPPGGKGVSPLASPITLVDDLSPNNLYGAGTTSSAAWTAAGAGAFTKYGARLYCPVGVANLASSLPEFRNGGTRSVRNSGVASCSQPGPGQPATITLTGADTTAYTLPTLPRNGNTALDTSVGYVISFSVPIEIPFDALTDLGVTGAGGSSTLRVDNRYRDVVMTDLAGAPNTGEVLANNNRVVNLALTTTGSVSKAFAGVPGNPRNTDSGSFDPGAGRYQGPPGSSTIRDGSTVVVPGQVVMSNVYGYQEIPPGTGDAFAWSRVICDTWDDSRLALTEGNYPGNPVSNISIDYIPSNGAGAWVSGWRFGDNSARTDIENLPNYSLQYSYTATPGAGANSACDTGTWYDSLEDVPGATEVDGVWSGVNRVRVSYSSSAAPLTPGGFRHYVNLAIAMTVLDTGNPVGDILPNWGSEVRQGGIVTRDQLLANPNRVRALSTYVPATHAGAPGDRLLLGAVRARLVKEVYDRTTSAFTNTGVPQYTSGDQVDYRLRPSLTADVVAGTTAGVVLEDCLPAFQAFVSSYRASAPGTPVLPQVVQAGSPPGAGLTCAPGETYVKWDLGQQEVGAPIDPLVYTADILATAPSGVLTNVALVTGEGDPTPSTVTGRRSSTQIQIASPRGIKIAKAADRPVVEVNPDGVTNPRTLGWTVTFANIDNPTAVSDVDVVDVLPADDEGSTSFTGGLRFDEATVEAGTGIDILYSSTPAADLAVDPSDASNGAAGSTVWCDAPSGGSVVSGAGTAADCPAAAAEVTGLRFLRPGTFTPTDQFAVHIAMTPSENAAGDIYTNTVAGRAQGVSQAVGPATRPITVIASSIGDYVWYDLDQDGVQDAGEPPVVGFPVRLTGTDVDGNAVSLDTTTDADGAYAFDGLASGDYTVTFEPDGLTGGEAFTAAGLGGDGALDSDGDATTGVVPTFALAPNSTDPDVDQGIVPALGSISLTKAIVDPASFDDLGDAATFPVTVECSGPTGFPDVTRDVTIARDGTPTVVEGLWAGSSCSVTETATDGGTVTYSPATPITVVDGQSQSVVITNTFPAFPTGSISLSKTIVDPAPFDDLGDAATFPVTVSCTGPGTAPDVTREVTIARDGTPTVVAGLYAGSVCTVTETGTDGGTVTYAPATPVTVVDGQSVSVTITNTFPEFPTGSISLSKAIVDPAPFDDLGDAATFPVTVSCTGPDDAPDVTREVTIARDGTPTVVDGLYAGSVCTITETATDGGTVTYAPATPVTVVDGQSVSVTITNTFPEFPTGSISLSKVIVDPAPWDDTGDDPTFPVTVACTGPGEAPDVTREVTIARDGSATVVDGLYAGSTCTITETGTDAGTVAYSPATPVTVVDGQSVSVTITNTFPEAPVGGLVLSKAIVDPFPGDELGDAGSFPVTVACTGPTGAPDETTMVLLDRDGTPVNVEALVGATCTVTETDTDGGTVAYTPGSVIEITGTAAVTVTVTNTFPSETTTTSTTSTTSTTVPGSSTSTSTTVPGSTSTSIPSSVVPTSINNNPVDPPGSGSGTSNAGSGALPRTGASIFGLVLVGAVSLGLGALVLRTRRRFQGS